MSQYWPRLQWCRFSCQSFLRVGNDVTGQFGTSKPDLSLFYSLNVKKDVSSTETVYTGANYYEGMTFFSDCKKMFKPNCGDEQNKNKFEYSSNWRNRFTGSEVLRSSLSASSPSVTIQILTGEDTIPKGKALAWAVLRKLRRVEQKTTQEETVLWDDILPLLSVPNLYHVGVFVAKMTEMWREEPNETWNILSPVNLFQVQIQKAPTWNVYRTWEHGFWWNVFCIVKILPWMWPANWHGYWFWTENMCLFGGLGIGLSICFNSKAPVSRNSTVKTLLKDCKQNKHFASL